MELSEKHFNDIAEEYDFWKKKNHYYYDNLKELFSSVIPVNSSLIEVGCGTGDILAFLKPSRGLGIDISAEMIRLAAQKHAANSALTFARVDIFDEQNQFEHDNILLVDVLEHVENLPEFIKKLSALTRPGAKIVISVANPLWEPVLMVAEKLGMKMPEGPHKRYTIKQTEKFYTDAGLKIEQKGFRLGIPKKMPGSDWYNKRFHKNSLLARTGFVIYWVLTKAKN